MWISRIGTIYVNLQYETSFSLKQLPKSWGNRSAVTSILVQIPFSISSCRLCSILKNRLAVLGGGRFKSNDTRIDASADPWLKKLYSNPREMKLTWWWVKNDDDGDKFNENMLPIRNFVMCKFFESIPGSSLNG